MVRRTGTLLRPAEDVRPKIEPPAPPLPVARAFFPIGLYILGPIRLDQRETILSGVRLCAEAGVRLGFCLTNVDEKLAEDIKLIMPDAEIVGRRVYTGRDPLPWSNRDSLPNGAEYFREWWNKEYSHMGGVDYFALTNEGWDNEMPPEVVKRIGTFFMHAIDEAIKHKTMITALNCNAGTPGLPGKDSEAHYIDDLGPCLQHMVDTLTPFNYHCYDLLDKDGHLMDRSVSMLRHRVYTARYPDLIVIGGEGGNAAKADNPNFSGMFGPWTKGYFHLEYDLFRGDPNVHFMAHWCICDPAVQRNPEGVWADDDWFSILGWFFDFVIELTELERGEII